MGRTQIREVRYKTSEYMRVTLFPVYSNAKKQKRAAKANPTPAVQAALNAKNAARLLSDLIHLNFTPNDCAIHPTYADGFAPSTDEEAMNNITNYFRRLRRLFVKKNGTSEGFKYVYVTERTKKGRFHHHLIISAPGITYKEMIDCWGMGRCNPRPLEFDEHGLLGLSHYMVKDPVGSRRWGCSKGLARPAPQQNDTRFTQKDMAKLCGENPDVITIAKKYYPNFTISDVQSVVTAGGTFIELFLYRTDNKYFWYDRWGRIHYGLRRNE